MRYIGPKLKIVRHIGGTKLLIPGFTSKSHSKRERSRKKKKRPKSFLFSNRLKEKQKLRFNFNITNHKLFNYLKQAKKISGLADKSKAKEKKELMEMKKTMSFNQSQSGPINLSKNTHQKQRLPHFQNNSKQSIKTGKFFLISKSKKDFILSKSLNKDTHQLSTFKNFSNLSHNYTTHRGSIGDELIKLLESRFDSIIFRLYFAPTINMARQLISHGHFLINNKKVNIPSYHCNGATCSSINQNT